MRRRDLIMQRRDLIMRRRDLIMQRRDLIMRRRDLIMQRRSFVQRHATVERGARLSLLQRRDWIRDTQQQHARRAPQHRCSLATYS